MNNIIFIILSFIAVILIFYFVNGFLAMLLLIIIAITWSVKSYRNKEDSKLNHSGGN